jgi:pSer/pThr/pTyr-binding forkhead associated (FHA) protein
LEKTPPVYVFKIQTPKRATTLRLAGPFFVLGRGEPYKIFHEDPTLSREHLAVVTTDAGYRVKDLGSRNGVFLNGKRLGRYAEQDLSLGDVLVAGNTKVQLVLQQEASQKDSVIVEADGRTTEPEVLPEAEEDEDLGGEVTGELERPDLPEDDDPGEETLAEDLADLADLDDGDDDGDPEKTQLALDEDDELLGELPESVDSLASEIDAASTPGAALTASDAQSELELDTVANDLGVTAEELEADLDADLEADLDAEDGLLEE